MLPLLRRKPLEKVLSEQMANRREELGLTQAQVAAKLGIVQQAYDHYENNRRNIPISLLAKIAKTLDIDIEVLLNLEKRPRG